MSRCLPLLALVLVLSLSCSRSPSESVNNSGSANSILSPSATPGSADKSSVVLRIPVGEGGVSFENIDAEELEPWGPSAFTIGPDGTFYIADAVNNKILRFRPDGSQMAPIPVEGVVGISDITVSDDGIFVLDKGATTPAVMGLNLDGKVQAKNLLLPSPGHGELRSAINLKNLSGLATADDGAVLLEFESGAVTRRLDSSRALDRCMRGKNYSVKVPLLQNQVSQGGRGSVLLNGQPFAEIKVDNYVAELRVVSVNAAGEVFVVVDEINGTPQVDVDETIRRYSADGKQMGIARVPIRELRSYNMANTVGPDQNCEVVAIDYSKDKSTVDLVKLPYETHLEPIMPKFTPNQTTFTPPAPCRTRQQMAATAEKYRRNKFVLNVDNIDGECAGRRKPHYLKGMGEYSSVPYDWAGFDTVENYNQLMSENKRAGDITSNGVDECSRGIDCSGFVLRCWGFDKRGDLFTGTLPNISTEISILQLQAGDILNFPGKHVILFDKTDAQGKVWAWEATTMGLDRVVYQPTSWRRWLGYTARRYNKVC